MIFKWDRNVYLFREIQEQRNALEAKEDARKLAEAHEKRVASLEARLAEFSERIGSYDRLRQQDLATVSKLKVPVLLLLFSCALFKLSCLQEQLNAMQDTPSPASNYNEEEFDVQKIIDKITSLKSRLIEISRRSNANINLTGNLLSCFL